MHACMQGHFSAKCLTLCDPVDCSPPGFLAGVVKNPPANAGDIKRGRIDPWVRKIAWRRK